jgi:UPF0755 protein
MAAIARLVAILISLVVCLGAGVFVYVSLGNVPPLGQLLPTDWDRPMSDTHQREAFQVKSGQSATAIGEELERRGLIRSSLAFRWEVQSKGVGAHLGAGDYELSPSMSTREIVAVLARGAASAGTRVTILEGWRADQVALRIEQFGLGQAELLLRIVRAPREHGLTPPDTGATTLEGYLFPETYEFEPGSRPDQILQAMIGQFNRRFDEALRGQAAGRGLTLGQAVTLASIIEREAAEPSERPIVASVFHNRLSVGMKLDADPTVQYAVDGLNLRAAATYGFWKRELTLDDLQVDSPYNTYRLAGLPPGPICSPGLDSLKAAVSPAQTRYLYFVARGDGTHAFAETEQEHQVNVQRYR